MKNTDTAALICRVSTREQEEGYSLEAQERLLREYCLSRSLRPILVRSFSETASKYTQRTKFMEFVREVRKMGTCHIIAEKVDRVSRSGSRDAVLIDDWVEEDQDRHLHLVKQSLDIHKYAPSTVKFVWAMHVAVAKHTSDNLSEEVRKTADVMLCRGIWPTKALIGYLRDKDNAASPIQPDPMTSLLVRKMFELYDTGEWSVARLSFKMEELGLLNGNGHRIMPSRIHELLQDPFYVGKMLYRNKVWDGAHEPIVSYDLFDRVQRRLRRKEGGIGATLYSKHEHLLSGIVTCGTCKKPLSWEVHGPMLTYGYCKQYRACGHRAAIKEGPTEEGLFPDLNALVVRNERLADWIGRALAAAGDDDAVLKALARGELEGKIAGLSEKASRLLDLRLDGEIEKEDYEQRRGALAAERDRLTSALKSLDLPLSNNSDNPTSIYELGRRAPERYRKLPPAERKGIIREVFATVEVTGASVRTRYTRSYELLAKAVAATNSSKVGKSSTFEEIDFETLTIGFGKQKDQPFAVGHPVWLTAWEEFRKALVRAQYHVDGA